MKITLTHLKKNRHKLEMFKNLKVFIYSGQWDSYWRKNYCGYTCKKEDAGIYDFVDAWEHTSHCGPEKRIEYRFLNRSDEKNLLNTSDNSGYAVTPTDAPKLPSLQDVKDEVSDYVHNSIIEETYYAIQRLGNFS